MARNKFNNTLITLLLEAMGNIISLTFNGDYTHYLLNTELFRLPSQSIHVDLVPCICL